MKHRLFTLTSIRIAIACGTVMMMICATARAAGELVIGQVAPLTGSNASNGKPVSEGIKLYFDYINANGGIQGKRIKFIVRDDAYKVSETVRHARDLITKEQVLALMTTLGTANNEALLKEKLSGGAIPMLGPRSGASSLYSVPGLFPVRASYHDEARAIIRQLTTTGLTRIATVYQEDSFGADALRGIENALKDNKLELTARAGFERNTVKVGPAVEQMLKSNPPAIVMLAVTDPTAAFVREFRARGGSSQIICLSIVDPAAVIKHAGVDAARGLAMTVVVPGPNQVTLPIIKEMRRAREVVGATDFTLTLNSIEGFIYGKVMAEALRRSGPAPTRATVLRALEQMQSIDVGGYTAKLKPSLSEQRYVDLAVIGAGGALLQ